MHQPAFIIHTNHGPVVVASTSDGGVQLMCTTRDQGTAMPMTHEEAVSLHDALSKLITPPTSDLPARFTDAERIDWLEKAARKSRTGISFDWVPAQDGERAGYRFMRQHHLGENCSTLRRTIDLAMHNGEWQP